MDQQSATTTRITDTDPTSTDTATQQHLSVGPNDTCRESNATAIHNNANLVTAPESQIAESKQFMSDSKKNVTTEIDFSSKAPMSLQSNPNTTDMESFSTSDTQKDENNKEFNVTNDKPIKDASGGSSSPSFVVLEPVRTRDEPSSTVSLWSMPGLSLQFSLPSALSSMDASGLYSGEYTRSQVKY